MNWVKQATVWLFSAEVFEIARTESGRHACLSVTNSSVANLASSRREFT